MNKIIKMLCAACTLAIASFGLAKADSSNFAGPYIGVSISGYGMQMSGTAMTSPTANTYEYTDVSIGQVAPVQGFEAGYALPIGSAFLIDIGAASFTGEAELEFHNDDLPAAACSGCTADTTGHKDVTLKIDKLVTGYIAPTLVLSDTSSLYIKVALSEADVTVSGDITSPANLSGTTWAMGTRTVLDSGIFVRTEAGYTDYNEISAAGKGNNISSDNTYMADPTVAFGTVSLGFRF